MKRDKRRDNVFLSSITEDEINYMLCLYDQKKEVREFLKKMCDERVIKYMTHSTVYKLIENELGYKIPE
jgi:hypothetical protein